MREENPTLRTRGDAPAVRREDFPPSAVAQARLADALRNRSQAYQQGAAVDLTIMGALLRLDRPEAAVQALEDHRAALQAMARDLQVAVADAAVEREAERVCSAVAQAEPAGRPLVSTLRRRVLAVSGAAAVIVALLLPAARFAPRTTLTSVEGPTALDDVDAARERLEAARNRARTLRENISTQNSEVRTATPPRTSGEVVRDRVRTILAADTSGGSAASTVAKPADVVDLDAHRAKRDARAKAATPRKQPAPPDAKPPPPPPAAPADTPPVAVPEVKVDAAPNSVPLGTDTAVDTDDVPAAPDVVDHP